MGVGGCGCGCRYMYIYKLTLCFAVQSGRFGVQPNVERKHHLAFLRHRREHGQYESGPTPFEQPQEYRAAAADLFRGVYIYRQQGVSQTYLLNTYSRVPVTQPHECE